MRKRQNDFHVYLNDDELERLNELCRKIKTKEKFNDEQYNLFTE